MREILFRGKSEEFGKWVYGGFCAATEKYSPMVYSKEDTGLFDINQGIPVIPETVCQYTGLTDKNCRKIFEGDILMCHGNKNDLVKAILGSFYVIDIETLEKVDEVIGWYYEVIPTDSISKTEPFNLSMPLTDMYIKTCEMEVIGNIFDNPSLLADQPKKSALRVEG